MRLKDYLYFNNIKITEFSKKVGVSRAHLSQFLLGNNRISQKLATQIAKATNHELSVKEIMELNPNKRIKICPHCHKAIPPSSQNSH